MTKEKLPRGRPTKYRPEMDARAVELGAKGKTIVQIAADLGLAKETIYQWINPESETYRPSFSDAVQTSRSLAEAFWFNTIDSSLYEKDLNTQLLALRMRNSHGWDSKQKVEHTGKDGGAIESEVTFKWEG